MYTFHLNETCMEETYEEICNAYKRIFDRLELDVKRTVASVGQMGGSKSEEFHMLTEVGEDKIFVCECCGKSASLELIENGGHGDKQSLQAVTQARLCHAAKCGQQANCMNKEIRPKRAIECGHTFILGDRYTKQIPISVQGGQHVLMACYGIGVSRLMQVCVEVLLWILHITKIPR